MSNLQSCSCSELKRSHVYRMSRIYSGIIVEVYDYDPESPLQVKLRLGHEGLTISVYRLGAVGRADVAAGDVCGVQPQRRSGARAGNTLLAGKRRGQLLGQGASA